MLATDIVILAWVRLLSHGRLRTIISCLFAIAAGFFAVSILGADIYSDVLITGLQLWRVQWLMHFMAMSLLPIVLFALVRGSNLQILCAILLTYAALNRGLITGGLALVIAGILALAARRREIPIERKLVLAIGAALVGGMLVMWNNNATWDLRMGEVAGIEQHWSTAVLHYLRKPSVGPLLVTLALAAAMWRWPRSLVPAAAAIVVSVTMVAVTWDQRSPWTRVMEEYAAGTHPFAKHIGPEEEVYWANQALAPWLMLHRRTYVSGPQLAGMAFNRDSADQIERRNKVVALFEFQAEVCGMFNALKGAQQEACEPDIVTVRTACETDSKLSFVVTQHAVDQAWMDSWQATVNGLPYRKYYLYGCRQLLASDKGRIPS
jgi:hypothetical protein